MSATWAHQPVYTYLSPPLTLQSPGPSAHIGSSASSAISTDSLASSNEPEAEQIQDGNTIKLEPKPFAIGGYADVYRATWKKPNVGEIVVAVKVLRMKGISEDMPAVRDKQQSRIDKVSVFCNFSHLRIATITTQLIASVMYSTLRER